MADKKIIAVVGATGQQGGGVAHAILSDPASDFAVRALTRDPSSDKAKALEDAGAEVVQADIDDEARLVEAFEGAYGAFCITFFWEHTSAAKEIQEAGNQARAAKAAGLQHVVWSTLEDSRKWIPLDDDRMPTLQEKYKVPHFDAKWEANQAFTDAGVPTTFLLTAFYWENFIFFGLGPQRGEDGKLAVTYPLGDKKLPSIASQDIGKCVYAIFQRGDEFIGKTVGIAGGHPTGAELAAAFTKALGEEVAYNDVPPDMYRGFGFPFADETGNMFQFKRDANDDYVKARSIEFTRSLDPELQTLDAWLAENKDRIPIS
jgi:uncharacterized protein YbjT (DUF2867 family)